MAETTDFAPGTFCWADSGTDDLEKAKAFYGALFGWDFADSVDPSGYTMCLKDGLPVAGLYALDEQMRAMGASAYWLPYVAVADVDASLAAAVAAGATPLGEVMDAQAHGRGAAFTDPTGAMCGMWQPRAHKGSGRHDEHGTVVWDELQTGDTGAAGAFYSRLFGWRVEEMPMPDGPYYLLKAGDTNRGGMMAITPAMGGTPPNWQVYFQVDDADAAVAAAAKAGGTVLAPVMEVPGVGRMAFLRSADGAHFSILQPAPMA